MRHVMGAGGEAQKINGQVYLHVHFRASSHILSGHPVDPVNPVYRLSAFCPCRGSAALTSACCFSLSPMSFPAFRIQLCYLTDMDFEECF
jgi:hypothetical protein